LFYHIKSFVVSCIFEYTFLGSVAERAGLLGLELLAFDSAGVGSVFSAEAFDSAVLFSASLFCFKKQF